MDIKIDANLVLQELINQYRVPKTIYPSNLVQFEELIDYEYCISVFKYILYNCPEFIIFLEGTKPGTHIQIKPRADEAITEFLSYGGFNVYSSYDAFVKDIEKHEQLEASHAAFVFSADLRPV